MTIESVFQPKHLLLYIHNTQVELNINTQKVQSSLIIKIWNITQFDKWQIEHTFAIIDLVSTAHIEWIKLINVIQFSWIINSEKVQSLKNKIQNI